ncbi:hypothetical protein CVT24_011372 [Panaeolus cyanescens]|uniref:Uncharacterized protein n=1 Tax=Panaeolus cyanescens TaxID=181874 RepID=A0A409YGU1_9AGAR|nr:hypothetical protein CVT24_011372 [Panaeolus cyanescens]
MMAVGRAHTAELLHRRSSVFHDDLYTSDWLDESIELRRAIKRDVLLNRYNIADGTLRIITFSRALLTDVLPKLNLPPAKQGRIGWGSCAFDLGSRLGLLPSQPNARYAEYEEGISINNVVSHGPCYCGRISKQGLISLISHHVHSIVRRDAHVSFPASDGAAWSIEVNTRLGRFVLEDVYGGWFVHYDGNVCMEPPAGRIPDTAQNVDDIILAAQGQYLVNDSSTHRSFRWRGNVMETVEFLSTGNFFGLPNAVMYMSDEEKGKWKRLERFSKAVIRAMVRIIQNIKEPAFLVAALKKLPTEHKAKLQGSLAMNSVAEKLAACYYLCYVLSKKRIDNMEFDYFHMFTRMSLGDLTLAHQFFRSPRAEATKLFCTSQDRFIRMFNECSGDGQTEEQMEDAVAKQLGKLLFNNPNNVTLVVFQGFLSIVAQWNCARILTRSVVCPVEWLDFVAEDEDQIFIG